MRLWERCSELRGARRRSRYLTAKRTGRRRPNHPSGNPTGYLENLRLRRNRRSMNAWSLARVPGQWHPSLRAWIEISPHAWQCLSLVSMRPWSCFPASWAQAMKIEI